MFPATYVVHLLEEYFLCGGFPLWAERTLGVQLSNTEFVAWNALALSLMSAGVLLVSRDVRFRFIEIALAIAVLGNAAAHVIGTVATWTYSPGLITGVVFWIPLGWVRLHAISRVSSERTRRAGTCVGLFVIIVTLTLLTLSWRPD